MMRIMSLALCVTVTMHIKHIYHVKVVHMLAYDAYGNASYCKNSRIHTHGTVH